jgi:hypothetical protein
MWNLGMYLNVCNYQPEEEENSLNTLQLYARRERKSSSIYLFSLVYHNTKENKDLCCENYQNRVL